VVPLELPGGVRAWAATTHAAVRAVLDGEGKVFGKHSSHWAALRDGRVPADWPFLPVVLGEHLLHQDGDAHLRLRRLMSTGFTPARVLALRPRIEQIVDDLLDRVIADAADGKDIDLVPAFAEKLPIAVISELFGVPETERDKIRGWTRVLFAHTTTPEEAAAAHQRLVGFLHDLVDAKRRTVGDDLTSALVTAHDGGDSLSTPELIDCLFLLLIAGHETSLHMLGQGVINLLSHPEQLVLTKAGDRWDDVVEETLRLSPPVAAAMFRYALTDVEVADVTIPAGDAVLLCYGGAATDPDQHGPGASEFHINRERREHLAFSHGPHYCLGAPLARLEGRVGLERLFERLPHIGLAVEPDEIPYSPSFLTYGPLSVPVSIGTRIPK
jgi:cytochrome P450